MHMYSLPPLCTAAPLVVPEEVQGRGDEVETETILRTVMVCPLLPCLFTRLQTEDTESGNWSLLAEMRLLLIAHLKFS